MTRKIMTQAELAAHHTTAHGRYHGISDDGYDDMGIANKLGWHEIPGWGSKGWDLGDWPYVVIYTKELDGTFGLLQITEGDHDYYSFTTAEDREAAIDYMFLWYSAGQAWSPLTYDDRAKLEQGELEIPPQFRGPYRPAQRPLNPVETT